MATYTGDSSNNDHTGPEAFQYGLGGDDYLFANVNDKSYNLFGGDGDDELLWQRLRRHPRRRGRQ